MSAVGYHDRDWAGGAQMLTVAALMAREQPAQLRSAEFGLPDLDSFAGRVRHDDLRPTVEQSERLPSHSITRRLES